MPTRQAWVAVTLAPVLSEMAVGESPLTRAQAFWWRLGDNFFRRIVWYALPVVAFAALGVVQAGRTLELYQSSGTLTATSNPLVPNPTGVAAAPQLYETAAAAMSRVINEQLRTNEFLSSVAEQAGLGAQLADGSVTLAQLRASVWAAAQGTSILDVIGQWNDPRTSFQLATATIDVFSAYLRDTVGSDATEAERYYSDRITNLDAARQEIEDEYDAFVSTLPALQPGEEHSFDAQTRISRLQTELDALNASIAAAQEKVDDAQLTLFQLDSEIGNSFHIVDPPEMPAAPQSTRSTKLATIGSFTMLGVAASVAALLITSMIDRSVNSPAEILGIPGISLVATVDRPRRLLSRAAGSR